MRIPFVNLVDQNKQIERHLIHQLSDVISSGNFILGHYVKSFEERFAQYCGTKYAVAVNSGTDALIFAMKSLCIGPGDEVITVPNSFIATVSSIMACGAKPVFVDIGSDYNMNADLLENAINHRTKAIIPVHLTGRPVKMDTLIKIADHYRIPIVEDAAQAIGAKWRGKMVGALGNIGCFSLHPLKILGGLGDGGIITTNDKDIFLGLQKLRNFGLEGRDSVLAWGTNSRLDELQAAFLLTKMNFLDEWIYQRRLMAEAYREGLINIVQVPDEERGIKAVYQTFVILADQRDRLMDFLLSKGIETKIHYPIPLHHQPFVRKKVGEIKNCQVTETMAKKILSLPIYPEMEPDSLEYVMKSIREFYE